MKVLRLNINDYDDDFCQRELSHMEDSKRERALRFIDPADRKLCILGDYAVRALVSGSTGIPSCDVRITSGEYGAPFVSYPEDTGLYCSISHAGEYAAACIDNIPVGIDIELISSCDLRLADKICTQAELSYVRESGKQGLCRIWTVKEALLKSRGTGITDLNDLKEISAFDLPEGYYANTEEISGQYMISVISRK